MDALAAGEFRWSFVPKETYTEFGDAAEKGGMSSGINAQQQSALSEKIKEILG